MLNATPIVFLVDDDISVRKSLELLIDSAGWHPETFASAQEFLRRPRAAAPSCLVLEMSLPDLDGLELQKPVAPDRIDMPIIFISGYGDVSTTVRDEGGSDRVPDEAVQGRRIAARHQECHRAQRDRTSRGGGDAVLRSCCASLTPREREVMALVVSGLLNKQIGGELGISEITVKAHRGQVMRKMKAGSLPALVTMASRLGLRI